MKRTNETVVGQTGQIEMGGRAFIPGTDPIILSLRLSLLLA